MWCKNNMIFNNKCCKIMYYENKPTYLCLSSPNNPNEQQGNYFTYNTQLYSEWAKFIVKNMLSFG